MQTPAIKVSHGAKGMIPRRLRSTLYPLRRYYYPIIRRNIQPPQPEGSARLLYQNYISRDDIVVEVGARIGGGTLLLSELAGHVYSFEPVKFSFRMLKMYAGGRENVSLFNLAVGDRNIRTLINLPETQDFPFVASIKKLADFEYRQRQKVVMVKLDDILFPLEPTSLIVDCEGSEIEVLLGAKSLLRKLRTVLIETHRLSDGSETLERVVSILSKASDYFSFDVRKDFVDEDGRTWVIASRRYMLPLKIPRGKNV